MQDGTPDEGGQTSPAPVGLEALAAPLERALEDDGRLADGSAAEPTLALELYKHLVSARGLDLRFIALQRSGDIPFYTSALGEEAATCAPALALELGDAFFPGPRSALASMVRGVSIVEVVQQVFGTARSTTKGRGLPNHVSSREQGVVSVGGVPGGSLTHASGWGWAARLRNDRRVALSVVCGPAFITGDFHNAVNFAGVTRANVVFVCSVARGALAAQTASATVAEKGEAYGVPARRVDGRDALAVHRAVRAALAAARDGAGPSLIELVVARAKPGDDGSITLDVAECPLLLLERHLEQLGIDVAPLRAQLEADLDESFRLAVSEAKSSGPPGRISLFEDVFAEVPAHLLSQRDAAY